MNIDVQKALDKVYLKRQQTNICSMSNELEKKLERKILNSWENWDIPTTQCKQLVLALYWIDAIQFGINNDPI